MNGGSSVARRISTRVRVTGILSLAFLAGCGGGGGDHTVSSPSDFDPPAEPINVGGDGDLYDPERMLDIQISMSQDEFRTLREEGRTLASADRQCPPDYEYTEFTASVRIDGDLMQQVVIRKKGYLGSLSASVPSLKLDFNDLWDGRTYQHYSRMTLNNNRQDPSNARQCLAYQQFRDAGIAAPRCNYARISVNGEDLGVYSNVEPLKKPFLRRAFGDDAGNQYEAQTADFGTWSGQRFEKKTNESANDRSDLKAVADALALPDDQMVNVLPQLVNLDQFITFWAVETLLGAWDSATGNANNFHIYRPTGDGRFHFIPWGPDTAFRGKHPIKPLTGVLYRNFSLADRLYEIPEYRARYETALKHQLEQNWDETQLLAELERIRTLTGTEVAATESLEAFIASRRDTVLAALAEPEASGEVYRLEDVEPDCREPQTTRLSVTAKAASGYDTGAFQFTLPDGREVNASLTLAAFEVDSLVYSLDTEASPSVVSLLMIGADTNDNYTPYVLQLFIESPDYTPGTHDFHGFATNALLFEVDESAPGDVRTLALGADGSVIVTSAGSGAAEGDVELSVEATLEFGADAQ